MQMNSDETKTIYISWKQTLKIVLYYNTGENHE